MNSKIEIMGVLNITDNSFYDGGKFNNLNDSINHAKRLINDCLLYTSPSPRDATLSRMPSSA